MADDNGDSCTLDCMELNGMRFIGIRTFLIALILIASYVIMLGMEKPLGGLEGMVSFVLGFMFGNKGAAIASAAYDKIAKSNT